MRGHRLWTWLGLVVGLAFGLFLALIPAADAARNSGGTMSLVTGNPVIPGTVISSTVFNNTMTDFKTEITDSLSRSGKGAMLAPLRLANGSASLPALSFDSDTDTGIYKPDAGDLAISADGVMVVQVHGNGALFTRGIVVEQSRTDGAGIIATGNGNGVGVWGNGNGLGSIGINGVGGPDGYGGNFVGGEADSTGGHGVVSAGTGSAYGGVFTGGSSGGFGISATGGATNGIGIYGQGTGTQLGGTFVGGPTNGRGIRTQGGGTASGILALPGTAATATVPAHAIETNNGDIGLSGTPPNVDVSISNSLTTKNIVKMWATATYGTASPSVVGYNVGATTGSCATSQVTIPIGADMTGTDYAVSFSGNTIDRAFYVVTKNVGSVVVGAFTSSTGAAVDLCAASGTFDITVTGA